MRNDLPAGTVTLLFTDIEGSTRLLHRLGAEAYADALARHRDALRTAFAAHGGVEVDTQGDAFFVAFPTAPGAAAAALAAQEALADGPISVRMGLHTGTPLVTAEGYVGIDVHRGARIAALAHGGQILLTEATAGLLGDDAVTTALGLRRVKDFDAPVLLIQLGHEVFPAVRTPGAIDLPVPVTRFVGRTRELHDAVALWIEQEPRVLSVVGPGGAGKTRFALELARLLVDDADGATVFVALAASTDASVVVEQIAERLGATSFDAQGIADRIDGRRTHLVLDNVEQLLPAVARPLAELIRAAPTLRLIVTSREPLRIGGEAQLDLPPLDESDGTTLFLERAHAVRPDLVESPDVHELVRRLDCLPLALELAAARLKLLDPAQLLGRLDQRLDILRAGRDAEDRHVTLRDTIAWSHDLLDDDEKRLFARLGVFGSGCALGTAERVCDARLDVLESLVDKSLVRRRPGHDGLPRFWMLETIRAFAGEQLDRSGEREAMERARLAWLHDLAAETGLAHSHRGFGTAWTLDPIAAELGEIRGALGWGLEHAPAEALDVAACFEGFWVVRAPLEGAAWLDRLLRRAQDADPAVRACALRAQAGATEITGDFHGVSELYAESATLFAAVGDTVNALQLEFRVCANRVNLAVHAWNASTVDPEVLAAFTAELARFVERFAALEERAGECQALTFLGYLAEADGDLESADRSFAASEDIAREIGWEWWESGATIHRAVVARRRGDDVAARELSTASLTLSVRSADRMGMVFAAAELAAAATRTRDVERAGRLWGAIEAEEERAPVGQWPDERDAYATLVEPPEDERAAFERARERGRLLTIAQAAGLDADQTVP